MKPTTKYLPFLFLLAAILLFYWVKKNQRGGKQKSDPIEINTPRQSTSNDNNLRSVANLKYSKHARCRMDCRQIDESEVKEIIEKGTINYDKVEEDNQGKTYPFEGTTQDGQHVRIVIAPKSNETIIVTVIDLEKEWKCNCY